MQAPSPPPEASLLHRARESAEITMAEAAKTAGITDTRWSQIERGHERRKGIDVPARAKAGTLARMARAIGISPERLESEGQRPDAAEILREILRDDRPATVPRNPFAAFASQFSEPEDDPAWDMFPDPADKLLRWIWRMPVPVEDREQLVADIRARRRAAQEPPRRESACLPR
jgi:transcriptional regulator with XRE-family HTH domain